MAETMLKLPAVEGIKPPEAIIKVGNPIFGWLLRSPLHGLVDEHLMLLRFRGRKTERSYELPVGRRTIDGRLGVLTHSPWRVNIPGGAPSRTPRRWRASTQTSSRSTALNEQGAAWASGSTWTVRPPTRSCSM